MAHAQSSEHQELAIIKSIDDQDLASSYNDASEICLPPDLKSIDNFTVITLNRAEDLFNQLEKTLKRAIELPEENEVIEEVIFKVI